MSTWDLTGTPLLPSKQETPMRRRSFLDVTLAPAEALHRFKQVADPHSGAGLLSHACSVARFLGCTCGKQRMWFGREFSPFLSGTRERSGKGTAFCHSLLGVAGVSAERVGWRSGSPACRLGNTLLQRARKATFKGMTLVVRRMSVFAECASSEDLGERRPEAELREAKMVWLTDEHPPSLRFVDLIHVDSDL